MPRTTILKIVLPAAIVVLFLWWLFSPQPEGPGNQIVWSLAVHRPRAWRNTMVAYYAATDGALYVPDTSFRAMFSYGGRWKRKATYLGHTRFVTLATDADGNIAGGTADGYVYFSHDQGDHWTSDKVSDFPVSSIVMRKKGTDLFVGTFGGGMLEIQEATSDTVGTYFTLVQTDPLGKADRNIWCLVGDDNHLMAFTASAVYSSENGDANWQEVAGVPPLSACAGDGGKQVVARDYGGGLLISHDGGKTAYEIWLTHDRRLDGVWSLAVDAEGDMVAGTSFGPYWTQDDGQHWQPLQTNVTGREQGAAVLSFDSTLWGQEIREPVELRSGPTLLTPFNPSLNPSQGISTNPNLNLPDGRDLSIQQFPSRPGSPSAPGTNPATRVQVQPGEKSPAQGPGEYGGTPPPPPPPPPQRTTTQVFLGLACSQDAEGIECPAPELEEYLKKVLNTKDIAEVVAKVVASQMVTGKGFSVLADEAKRYEIDKLMHKIVERMMDEALRNVQNLAQASTPPMLAAVRAHEEYVRRLKDDAIRESIQDANPSFNGESRRTQSNSQLRLNTSGPAFHQLSYSALHGAGWW